MIWHFLTRFFCGCHNTEMITAKEQMRRERSKQMWRLYWPTILVMAVFLIEFIVLALVFIW